MADTADGDHLIQLGIMRTDDPGALRQQNRGGRDQMLERIAPFVDRVGDGILPGDQTRWGGRSWQKHLIGTLRSSSSG